MLSHLQSCLEFLLLFASAIAWTQVWQKTAILSDLDDQQVTQQSHFHFSVWDEFIVLIIVTVTISCFCHYWQAMKYFTTKIS